MYRVLFFAILIAFISCNIESPVEGQNSLTVSYYTKYYPEYDLCPDSSAVDIKFISCYLSFEGFKGYPNLYVNGIRVYLDSIGRYNIPVVSDKLCYHLEGEGVSEEVAKFSISHEDWDNEITNSIMVTSTQKALMTGVHNI